MFAEARTSDLGCINSKARIIAFSATNYEPARADVRVWEMCEQAAVLSLSHEGSTRNSDSSSHCITSNGVRGKGDSQRRPISLLVGWRLPKWPKGGLVMGVVAGFVLSFVSY